MHAKAEERFPTAATAEHAVITIFSFCDSRDVCVLAGGGNSPAVIGNTGNLLGWCSWGI